MPHHKHHRIFSLHSVRIKIHKTQKISRTRRTTSRTLTFQNRIQAQCSEIHHGSQRFINESSSPNHFPCNSSVNSPLKVANPTRSQRKMSEKKKEEDFKGFEPVKKKKRNHRFIFGIQAKNQQNRIKFKSS